MISAFRRIARGLAVAGIAAVLDQVTKARVLELLGPPGNPLPPFRGVREISALPFLDLVLTWNRGISFGFANRPGPWNALVFTALALIVAAYLVWMMAKERRPLALVAQGLIVGGALGNVLDRLRFGAVVDFLYVHIGAFDWWPAFNIADSAISIGAALWVLESLFASRDSHMNRP